MMPPNAPDTLSTETLGVLAAPGRGMALAAEALFTNPAIAAGSATVVVAGTTCTLNPRWRNRRSTT